MIIGTVSAEMQAVAQVQPAARCAPYMQASCCGRSDARCFTGQPAAGRHQRHNCSQRHSHMNTPLHSSSWQGLQSETGSTTKRRKLTTCAAQASELLEQGKQKYSSGDRMGALKLFERVLQTEVSFGLQDASRQDQQAALYNSTCVHASFGDLELAQMSLREGLAAGLDFEAALQDPTMVKMDSSAQVRIQLKRFSEAAKRIREAVGSESGLPAAPAMAKKVKKGQLSDADLSDLLDTELKPGLDTSLLGIVKRVVLLLLVAVIGGTVLFYAGLKFAFPDYKSIT